MTTGEILREARKNKKMTQVALAKKLGMGESQFIYAIESGKSKLPYKYIHSISNALGISRRRVANALVKDVANEIKEFIK